MEEKMLQGIHVNIQQILNLQNVSKNNLKIIVEPMERRALPPETNVWWKETESEPISVILILKMVSSFAGSFVTLDFVCVQ